MSYSGVVGTPSTTTTKLTLPLQFPDGTIQSTANVGGAQNIEEVLIEGNDANNRSIVDLASIAFHDGTIQTTAFTGGGGGLVVTRFNCNGTIDNQSAIKTINLAPAGGSALPTAGTYLVVGGIGFAGLNVGVGFEYSVAGGTNATPNVGQTARTGFNGDYNFATFTGTIFDNVNINISQILILTQNTDYLYITLNSGDYYVGLPVAITGVINLIKLA